MLVIQNEPPARYTKLSMPDPTLSKTYRWHALEASQAFHLPAGMTVSNLRSMDAQLTEYIGVLLLAALAVAATGGMILFSVILGKRGTRNKTKDSAYECGMLP